MEVAAAGGSIMAGFVPSYVLDFVGELDEHPWLFSAIASVLVGLSGILPLLVIPIDETASFENGGKLHYTLIFITRLR